MYVLHPLLRHVRLEITSVARFLVLGVAVHLPAHSHDVEQFGILCRLLIEARRVPPILIHLDKHLDPIRCGLALTLERLIGKCRGPFRSLLDLPICRSSLAAGLPYAYDPVMGRRRVETFERVLVAWCGRRDHGTHLRDPVSIETEVGTTVHVCGTYISGVEFPRGVLLANLWVIGRHSLIAGCVVDRFRHAGHRLTVVDRVDQVLPIHLRW